ncbi:MAG: SDR family oxidoreductase [Polyangiaceae bacterium]|nr:SDR family oxidoreductase [Myxococcales bacterium]MCB9584190.1 SDR family oxidoreductase [Polyangiaceae bacterium]MCB9608648.1 SDR family oxidoreductase [Polyangiaceae bacterium]
MTQLRALVTGAGTRVGQAIALALGGRGAKVAVHYHSSREGADHTIEQIRAAGGDGVALQADLSDRASAKQLALDAVDALGGLDLLVPSAANFERVALDDVDDGYWDRAMDLNLRAPFLLAHGCREALKQSKGSITFITCSSATVPFRNHLPYTVSKAAVRHLMRTLSLELAPDVRVNAIAPGTVLPPPDMSEEALALLTSRIPLNKVGSAQDIARTVLFLLDSPFITGHEVHVDGGRSVAGFERFV